MAPLTYDFTDNVDISNMVGTWAATFITGIGLIAIYSQLRSAVLKVLAGKDQLKRQAGDYFIVIPKNVEFEYGLYAATLPSVQGLLQHYYMQRKSISIAQDEYVCNERIRAGTSSWSQLLSHCNITPDELLRYGGPRATILPAKDMAHDEAKPVGQADLSIANGRVQYGLMAGEFTMLLILAGFQLSAFQVSGFHQDKQYLGLLRMAEGGPFDQVALFDPHAGIRSLTRPTERGIHEVPVRQCIDLALGVIPTNQLSNRQLFIILPACIGRSEKDECDWTIEPSHDQLADVHHSIEHLNLGSGSKYTTYKLDPAELELFRHRLLPHEESLQVDVRPAFVIGLALASISPWALLALLPVQLKALAGPLQFIAQDPNTPHDELFQRVCNLQAGPPSGWRDNDEWRTAIRNLGNVNAIRFRSNSNFCARYYDAMVKVFAAAGLSLAAVRANVAAEVAADRLGARGNQNLIRPMITYFSGTAFESLRGDRYWALVVYARYLAAWLLDSLPADLSGQRFRRRVFLG